MKNYAICAAALMVWAGPAMAADYYPAGKYITANDGEGEVLVNADNVHTVDGGYKGTEVVVVNATGVGVVVYDVQFDCPAKTWRVATQYNYYTERTMAPTTHAPRELPPFAPVYPGTPIVGAMNMVCAWPGSIAGIDKIAASDPIELSLAVSPTLVPPKRVPPPRD